jgi:ribosome biogenesis GTPase / thiamine phosphate phosphatase
VEYELNSDGSGVILSIGKRKNYISRKMPKVRGASYRGERLEQVIAANIDRVFIISSINEPQFNNKTIDRFLATCESCSVEPVLVINKSDLDKKSEISFWKELYENIGYKVIVTSTLNYSDFDELKNLLDGYTSLFWGQSGVGKSSLLNMMYPVLKLKTGEISSFTSKGTHTTVTAHMYPVDEKTFIIDTPGVREIDPYGIRKENLAHFFIEFKNFINECKFNTCTHEHEPGCAIQSALEEGKISELRYGSYLRMLETVEEDINF